MMAKDTLIAATGIGRRQARIPRPLRQAGASTPLGHWQEKRDPTRDAAKSVNCYADSASIPPLGVFAKLGAPGPPVA